MESTIQLIADGVNIDLLSGQNIAVTFRSKFFQSEQGSRTWQIKCARTPTNVMFFDQKINNRTFVVSNVILFFGGIELIRGSLRILGYDDTSYNVILISAASTALIDDQRKIVDIFRDEINRRGGFGAADLSDFHSGSQLGGMADGRWLFSDYWDYSLPTMASEIKRIKNADNSGAVWPSDEFLNSNANLNKYRFCATDTIQLGGWSGEIINSNVNRLPAHVYGGFGRFRNKFRNNLEQDLHFIEFDKLDIYGDTAAFKIRDDNQNCSFFAIGEINGNKLAGHVISDFENNGSRVKLAGLEDFINCRPYIAFLQDAIQANFDIYRVDKLLLLIKIDSGGGNWYNYNDYHNLFRNLNFVDTPHNCVSFVNFNVQELPIEQTRKSKHNITNISNFLFNFDYWTPSVTTYYPNLAFGDIRVCDVANFCLHVLNCDLDKENSADAALTEVTTFDAQNLICEFQTENDNLEIQNKSSVVGVTGADGLIFKRGGGEVANLKTPFKGGGTFPNTWLFGGVRVLLIGTTAEAANAEIYKGSGVYIFSGQWYDNLNFGDVFQFSAGAFIGKKIGSNQNSNQSSNKKTVISKSVKYTASGRGTGDFLLNLKKDGQISILGYGILGFIDEVQWDTSGAVKIVFWG